MSAESARQQHVVVVGAGMVAFRFVEALRGRDDGDRYRITVIGDEPRPPYDRVALTTYFTGRDPRDLHLGADEVWQDPLVTLRKGTRVTAIDRAARCVRTDNGDAVGYDHLVLATGSYATRPPVDGRELRGCFVYRTIDDVAELRGHVETLRVAHGDRPLRGVAVGGGLLGLEAAGALQALGVQTTVVEFAPRLMPLQVDEGGGAVLRRLIEDLGVEVLTDTATTKVLGARRGVVEGMRFADGTTRPADVVVFATGVRPRDELARSAGLSIGERGGVVVDGSCCTDDPEISAVGEVACIGGQVWGLVAPGYAMAEVAADRLLGGAASFPGADSSTKLKLLGVDVASFGDAFGTRPGCLEVSYSDAVAGVYKKLVLSDDARTLLGGILVGDASSYSALRPMIGQAMRSDPSAYLVPTTDGPPMGDDLPDGATVCSCNNVTAGSIRGAVAEQGCCSATEVKACTGAGTSCGSCLPLVKRLTDAALEEAGVVVAKGMCEHFDLSRAELFNAVQVTGLRTFSDIIARHGRGRGCDICKPVVASVLASLGTGHILDDDRGTLQDTNDHMLANLQKDGSYSIVPRIPGGEVTPDGLIEIGRIAKEFDLYTKITGGQRIDMFGARVEQLPRIWRRLVDVGFESGHAYGKAVRTVKSCVGTSWCRYGVQDSVAMAIRLELRYRGLRSPHKLKLGVSGCARECAEARGKDAGVIATDQGWNLYVGGNGGFAPRHATLLAENLDDVGLIRAIDRFFIYYVRTADRLQRTSAWLEALPGGIEHLRDVVLQDTLGIGADLDAAMERHVASYRDEWSEVLDDPVKLARFTSFVNAAETPDPDLHYEAERGQRRPVMIAAGDRIEVRT